MSELAKLEKRLDDYRAVKGPHWMVEVAQVVIPKLEAEIAFVRARASLDIDVGEGKG